MPICRSTLPAVALLLISTAAQADLYKCAGNSGETLITSNRSDCPNPKSAQVYRTQEPNVISSGSGSNTGSKRAGNANRSSAEAGQKVTPPSPANFPKVDSETQRSRDSNRKRILQDELANEQTLLNNTRKALSEAESTKSAEEKANPSKYLERIGRLRENVVMHEKNIAALQKELSRVQ